MHEILLHQWNHVYLQENFDPLSKKEKVEAGKKYTQTKKTDTYKEQTVNYQYP